MLMKRGSWLQFVPVEVMRVYGSELQVACSLRQLPAEPCTAYFCLVPSESTARLHAVQQAFKPEGRTDHKASMCFLSGRKA
jgi:hypothetical protein